MTKETKLKVHRPKATENLAKDVETPKIKLKRIDIPDNAKVPIARMKADLDNFIAGVVAGLGIEGKWGFDGQKMQVIVEDKK